MGPTKAIISKKNLYHNFSYLTDKFEKKISIIAIVKANEYGHGAVEISKILSRKKIDYLGVANIQEANELIDHGIKKRILILGSISNHEMPSPRIHSDKKPLQSKPSSSSLDEPMAVRTV